MSLFGTNVSHRMGVKQTAHPVDISEEDVEIFRALNSDERIIRERIERVRVSHPELQDMTAEEALIVMTKMKHHNRIQKNLRSVTNVAKTISLFVAEKDSCIFGLLNVARECRTEISTELARLFGADLQLESQESKASQRKIVVSQVQRTKVSTLLRKCKVPEGIASDVETIYVKGSNFEFSDICALGISLCTRYFTGEEEEPDKSAFDFSHQAGDI